MFPVPGDEIKFDMRKGCEIGLGKNETSISPSPNLVKKQLH